MCVDVWEVLNVHLELLELPCELLAVLFPGVIAPYPITPALWVHVKWPIVDLQSVLIGCIEVVNKAAASIAIWHMGNDCRVSLMETKTGCQSPMRKLHTTYRKHKSLVLYSFLLIVSGGILDRILI